MVVSGKVVTRILVRQLVREEPGVMFVLDGRLAITVTGEEGERFVPFLADAIATALGYTCHPMRTRSSRLLSSRNHAPSG